MFRLTDLLLVCSMPSQRDLKTVRLLGWYRIPLRTEPRVMAADDLASNQTSAFGECGGPIEFLAQVKSHELTTGGELLEAEADPRYAKEEYDQIPLGGLEKISPPFVADKWKHLTFVCRTGKYLLNARLVNDLVVQNEEREILWKNSRERAEHEQLYKTDLPAVAIPPDVLRALLGIKDLHGDSWAEDMEN